MPSNTRDEPLIHHSRGSKTEIHANQTNSMSTGLAAEINSDRGEVLVRGFWYVDKDHIVDACICDDN